MDIFKVYSEIGGTIFLRNVCVCVCVCVYVCVYELHHYTSLIDFVEIARNLQEVSLSNGALVELNVLSVVGQ